MSASAERALGQRRFVLSNEQDTIALGGRLAGCLKPGDCLALAGDLGVGKTSLARSIIQASVGEPCPVPSPTFTLVQTYDLAEGRIWHFDLYRLGVADELLELGWDEALTEISLIEWADRAERYLPADRVTISLAFGGDEDERSALIEAPEDWLAQLMASDTA